MHEVFWQHETNRPDGRHRARGVDCRETSMPSDRRCITQQVRPYGRGAVGSGCHPLHPNRGRCPPWPYSHQSLGVTTRAAVCLPRYAHHATLPVKFARVQYYSCSYTAVHGSGRSFQILSQMPISFHRHSCAYTVCHGGNSAGTSRHRHPVCMTYTIASSTIRRSYAYGLPVRFAAGSNPSSRRQTTSVTSVASTSSCGLLCAPSLPARRR